MASVIFVCHVGLPDDLDRNAEVLRESWVRRCLGTESTPIQGEGPREAERILRLTDSFFSECGERFELDITSFKNKQVKISLGSKFSVFWKLCICYIKLNKNMGSTLRRSSDSRHVTEEETNPVQ